MLLGMNPDYVRQGLLHWSEKSKEAPRAVRRRALAGLGKSNKAQGI